MNAHDITKQFQAALVGLLVGAGLMFIGISISATPPEVVYIDEPCNRQHSIFQIDSDSVKELPGVLLGWRPIR